jgi:hypothetical protein
LIIDPHLSMLLYKADMLACLDADCAQTARISLHSSHFQRAQTQKLQDRQSLGASRNPHLQIVIASLALSSRPASNHRLASSSFR